MSGPITTPNPPYRLLVHSRLTLFVHTPQVCSTNLTGAVLCCQKAVKIMSRQQGVSSTGNTGSTSGRTSAGSIPGGTTNQVPFHVYNFGFSKWGASFSKSTCTHKATKRGLSQLTSALSEELTEAGVECVGVHQLSPGMVLTDLLLEVRVYFFDILVQV